MLHCCHSLLTLDLHITIGRVVLDVFEDAVVALINSSLKLAFGKYFTYTTYKYIVKTHGSKLHNQESKSTCLKQPLV